MSDYKQAWAEAYDKAKDEGWNDSQAALKADQALADLSVCGDYLNDKITEVFGDEL